MKSLNHNVVNNNTFVPRNRHEHPHPSGWRTFQEDERRDSIMGRLSSARNENDAGAMFRPAGRLQPAVAYHYHNSVQDKAPTLKSAPKSRPFLPSNGRDGGKNVNKGNKSRQLNALKSSSNQSTSKAMNSHGAPVSIATKVTTRAPVVTRSKTGGFRVKHRELVTASISSSVAFATPVILSINPGLVASFPWLAPQASQYEQYVVHSLTMQYIPFCATST